jgi:hypothetical protein
MPAIHTEQQPPSSSSGHSLQIEKKRLGGPGLLPKIALLKEEVLISNTMVERL